MVSALSSIVYSGCSMVVQSSPLFTPARITGCHARVHTPQPQSAITMAASDDTSIAARLTLARWRNRICLLSRVVWMSMVALRGRLRKTTAESATNWGSPKYAAIQGEQPKSSR